MSFDVVVTKPFERKLEKLAKRHKSLIVDLSSIVEKLIEQPTLGVSIGKDCYKIRLAI